jgi:hypothetical protein
MLLLPSFHDTKASIAWWQNEMYAYSAQRIFFNPVDIFLTKENRSDIFLVVWSTMISSLPWKKFPWHGSSCSKIPKAGRQKKNMQVWNHSSVSSHHHPVCFVQSVSMITHENWESTPTSLLLRDRKKNKRRRVQYPIQKHTPGLHRRSRVVRHNYYWCNPRNRLLWTIRTLATFLLVAAVAKWLSLFKAREQCKFSHLLQNWEVMMEWSFPIPFAFAGKGSFSSFSQPVRIWKLFL